jgi:hypothetical protein
MEFLMGAERETSPLSVRDSIERKLRGVISLAAILSGDSRQVFLDLSPDLQDGFIDTLLDLAESARRSNIPA